MYSSKGIHGILLTLIGLSLLLFPAAATAYPPNIGPFVFIKTNVLVQTTGEVKATFLGFSAAYSDDLYLETPTNALGIIFNNQSTPVGTEVSLGTFTAGTELIFRIHVNNTGDDFFSGPRSLNPDGGAHANVIDSIDFYTRSTSYVGFEDLFGAGDDFDDLKISLTNTTTNYFLVAPLPGTILLVSTGMGLMALLKRQRKDLV
jgi:hypothetical protein